MLKEKITKEMSRKIGSRTVDSHDLFDDVYICPQPSHSTEIPSKHYPGSFEVQQTKTSSLFGLNLEESPLLGVMGEKPSKEATKVNRDDEGFNPYEDNSGTTLCLKQKDFIVVAGDTRHSSEMVINSRMMPKVFRVGEFLLTGTGFYADSHEVYIKLVYEIRQYEVNGTISIHSAANLLSKILYSKRFFPHYSFCALSGFDDGKPYIYSYDPLGSFKCVSCICNGSGSPMVQPLLDSFIDKKNWNNADNREISQEDAVRLVIKAFNAAAERDVKTKDTLEIYVMRKDGLVRNIVPLRRD